MSVSEHGAEPRVRDLAVQWRTFLGIGVFILVIAVVYWFASYDYAGTVMLTLAAMLSFVNAAYLWTQDRKEGEPATAEAAEAESEDHYLPHASMWPFGIGVGAFLAFNGLILGLGFAVPGVIVIGVSIAGLVLQTRRRN